MILNLNHSPNILELGGFTEHNARDSGSTFQTTTASPAGSHIHRWGVGRVSTHFPLSIGRNKLYMLHSLQTHTALLFHDGLHGLFIFHILYLEGTQGGINSSFHPNNLVRLRLRDVTGPKSPTRAVVFKLGCRNAPA